MGVIKFQDGSVFQESGLSIGGGIIDNNFLLSGAPAEKSGNGRNAGGIIYSYMQEFNSGIAESRNKGHGMAGYIRHFGGDGMDAEFLIQHV